ncbi:HPr kinase/phosphorylase [Pseudovibrio exalbescens]|uniref:HPr kinase/phosphorylase C-terminal domain-containing protein n=1 Tax=Pseudovibrio exalbescens TaxID=197461 RepID=A0A1U7JI10_9HYPH|nr:HPr kinase/phosphatase C-terminal domain-containing protein [Pseudovibrio exalbescens]OKL44383.1 hypothetical protein A3843_08305 [Pseudovibrio exalbescens]
MTHTHHGSCIVLGEAGVLIRGASGSGKSGLALELIHREQAAGRFACLVADDQVVLEACTGRVVARCPEGIEGLIELRGHGLVKIPHLKRAVVRLLVDIEPVCKIERLPEPVDQAQEVCGVSLRRQAVPAEDFPAAVRLVQAALQHHTLPID